MSSMFRCAKALRITHAIWKCQENSDELKSLAAKCRRFLSVATAPADMTKHSLIKAFLASKRHIPDDKLDMLNHFADTININLNDHDIHASKSHLKELPRDILSIIGSYLSLKSSINLSVTNHEIFFMIHNDEYFVGCGKQTEELMVTSKLAQTILETNANMECFKKCKRFVICNSSMDNPDSQSSINKVECSLQQPCVIFKLAQQITFVYFSDMNFEFEVEFNLSLRFCCLL